MSATAEKSQLRLIEKKTESVHTGPGGVPLYFNNSGLFSDTFLIDHLKEIESKDQTAGNRFLNQFWNSEATAEFNRCYETLLQLWEEYEDILPTLSESQLEERWIKPVLKELGFEYEVQDRLKKRGKTQIPDYSLFAGIEDYKNSKQAKTDEAYFSHVLAVADAKAMGICLDGTGYSNSNPSFQIARYIEDTGKKWGVLTDGRYWRLYSSKSQSKHTTFYEVNLESLLSKRDDERFKYFYNLFRKDAFVEDVTSGQSFLDVVFEKGVFYAKHVEDNLKERVFSVVENTCRGMIDKKTTISNEDLKEVYDHGLYYVFRLMFILNCESKGLLNVDKQSHYFEYSLRKIVSSLKVQYETGKAWSSQPRTFNQIESLFDLIKDGDDQIGVYGFGEELFTGGDPTFFQKTRIPDSYLNEALVKLACDYDDDGQLQFIDYKRLSADHLGSIFEGLLEYNLELADKDYAIDSGKVVAWSDLNAKKKKDLKDSKILKGDLYLINSNRERKNSGSYYTPDFLVDFIVKNSLDPVCADLDVQSILNLNICDPSMGSAHFLLGVVRYIEEKVLERMETGNDSFEITAEEVRKVVLHNCVFGADLNPLAVELAKFSLWIYTARRGELLEPLDDQLKRGDSLVDSLEEYEHNFNWITEFDFLQEQGGFDVVVGNPPWDKLKATDLDFFRYFSQDYAMQTKKDKDSLKEKLLKNPEIEAAYEQYKALKEQMVEYLKTNKKYQNQVIELDGRKISGDTNMYKYFFEQFFNLTKPGGYYGIILPHSFMSDTGASGIRKLVLEKSSLKKAISFQNETNKEKAFQGVASNVKVCGAIAQKGGATRDYTSKFIEDFSELVSEDSFMKVSQSKYGKVFGDYRNIISLKSNADLSIHNKLNKFVNASDKSDGISLVVKSGEADMTNKKKYFTKNKTKYPLVTGREFASFSKLNPGKFVMVEFAETVEAAKKERVVIKAIMPDSIKKVQATIVPKKSILSNNLFSVTCLSGSEKEMAVLTAILNSDLIEYRVRCFLSNFRLTHRNLYQLPISKELFKSLSKKAVVDAVESLRSDPDNKDLKEKINKYVFEAYGMSESDRERIQEYIYGFVDSDYEEDSEAA